MIDPGVAAIIAAGVSLILGLASILRSTSDSKQAHIRDGQRRRAEAYVEVLRIAEARGLAVQDQMYNHTETGDDPYDRSAPKLPKREVHMPPRTDRATARALLAAFGTEDTRRAFEQWLSVVNAWEEKLARWAFESELNGPLELAPRHAEPERADERAARSALGEAVSREVQMRRVRAVADGARADQRIRR